jgi:uncharacterized protein YjbI with pentapeptide repeats
MRTTKKDMDAFDRLPPIVRKRLSDAITNLDAAQTLRIFNERGEAAALYEIDLTEAFLNSNNWRRDKMASKQSKRRYADLVGADLHDANLRDGPTWGAATRSDVGS